jgi:hypothetical protein
MSVRRKPAIAARRLAVAEGRAMVRVRRSGTRDLATVGVCPACWNIPERRAVLLVQLAKMDLEVAHRDDRAEGVYRPGKPHAPGCRHGRLPSDPWERFTRAVRGRGGG